MAPWAVARPRMGSAGDFRIRLATGDDASALACLAEACFRDAFSWYNTASDMDLYCRSNYGAAIQAAEIACSGKVTLVAESAGELIGFCQLHPHRGNDHVEAIAPIEVYRLYVVRPWQSLRVGRALLEHAWQVASDCRCDVVWLGVWEHNPGAIAFYRRLGFVEVGEQSFQLGTDVQRDFVMRLSIGTGLLAE